MFRVWLESRLLTGCSLVRETCKGRTGVFRETGNLLTSSSTQGHPQRFHPDPWDDEDLPCDSGPLRPVERDQVGHDARDTRRSLILVSENELFMSSKASTNAGGVSVEGGR